jgi:hypothetical protein
VLDRPRCGGSSPRSPPWTARPWISSSSNPTPRHPPDRSASDRGRAHVEGGRQSVTFADPNPVGTGPFTEVLRIRAHGLRAGPQHALLAARQAGRERPARPHVPHQRRDLECARSRRAGLGVALPAQHREVLGGP